MTAFHSFKVATGIAFVLVPAAWFAAAGCTGGPPSMPDASTPAAATEIPLPSSDAPVPPSRTRGPDSPRDSNVIMAFGDSLTSGDSSPSYPDILAGLTGKTVTNDGIPGSSADSGVGRAPAVILERNGACMLILYGINDLLFAHSPRQIAVSLDCIVQVCNTWHVTPVLATYPLPIRRHAEYARGTRLLNETIRHLAFSRGIRVVDLERAFMVGGKPDPALYLEDGLHPSARGNKVMARAFATLLAQQPF